MAELALVDAPTMALIVLATQFTYDDLKIGIHLVHPGLDFVIACNLLQVPPEHEERYLRKALSLCYFGDNVGASLDASQH